jgi:hypothetical protein
LLGFGVEIVPAGPGRINDVGEFVNDNVTLGVQLDVDQNGLSDESWADDQLRSNRQGGL